MRLKTLGVVCAITAAASFSVHAQSAPPREQSPSNPPQGQRPAPTTGAASRSEAGSSVTVMGCIEREADYRKATDAGKGGVVGTGVGVGNEFVLTHATTGTGTAAGTEAAYELSGTNEGQAAQFVGKRVEIMGMVKAGETNAAGNATGGATAGAPPRGVDVASKDLKLRELDVTSIKAATTGTCPAS